MSSGNSVSLTLCLKILCYAESSSFFTLPFLSFFSYKLSPPSLSLGQFLMFKSYIPQSKWFPFAQSKQFNANWFQQSREFPFLLKGKSRGRMEFKHSFIQSLPSHQDSGTVSLWCFQLCSFLASSLLLGWLPRMEAKCLPIHTLCCPEEEKESLTQHPTHKSWDSLCFWTSGWGRLWSPECVHGPRVTWVPGITGKWGVSFLLCLSLPLHYCKLHCHSFSTNSVPIAPVPTRWAK